MGNQAGKALTRILYESHGEVIDLTGYRDLSRAKTPQARTRRAVEVSEQQHTAWTKESAAVQDIHVGSGLKMGDERA